MSHYFGQLGQLPTRSLIIGAATAIAIGLTVWVAQYIRRMIKERPTPTPVAKPFLTNRKHAMLAALERILPMYRIHAQVSISAILVPGVRPGRRPRPSDIEALGQRIVDFVIVDPNSSAIVALVEMDERFAEPGDDHKRSAMTTQAGYESIRISASDRATIATAQAAVGHLRDAARKVAPAVTRLPMPVRTWPLEERFNGAG
ncbi:MAG: hypothetical protein BVN33_18030 [Proteobacteria bacterium ST_bin13]|nr:MAG: hypothetical protein BVN33_18030 [Proteobacteria bacterium ST_bin13]